MEQKHYDVTTGGNGDVLVIEDSGKFAAGGLEDDVCHVYGGNDADPKRAEDEAKRIAALLNLARGVSTECLVHGTNILLTVGSQLTVAETGAAMAYASGLHEMHGFGLRCSRPY